MLKPVDASGGYGLVIGPQATDEELAKLRDGVIESPRDWIAQEVVQLSTSPTHADGKFQPRHIDLRPFAVNDGSRVWVVPGGLTRVALPKGSLVVNSSQGGGSKDTWVLADPLATSLQPDRPAADADHVVRRQDRLVRVAARPIPARSTAWASNNSSNNSSGALYVLSRVSRSRCSGSDGTSSAPRQRPASSTSTTTSSCRTR